MRDIEALSDIADEYDAVLVDQFGVLHDGRAAFPGAVECLREIAKRGAPIAALSNSGKRAALNLARLERLGFEAALFRAVVTSGELAHAEIQARLADGRMAEGDRVAVLSRDDDASMIEGLPVRRVTCADAPVLLIIAGAEPESRTLESYQAEIAPLAEAGAPALCINPDRHIYADGRRAFGPGMIAELYERAGGAVEMLGKPGAEMFAAGLRAFGAPPPRRCLMIGDSPAHDIAGAKAAGCLTLLISSGVQAGAGGDDGVAADFRMPHLIY